MGSQQITHNKVIDIVMILIAVNYYYVEKIPYMYALNLGDSHKQSLYRTLLCQENSFNLKIATTVQPS